MPARLCSSTRKSLLNKTRISFELFVRESSRASQTIQVSIVPSLATISKQESLVEGTTHLDCRIENASQNLDRIFLFSFVFIGDCQERKKKAPMVLVNYEPYKLQQLQARLTCSRATHWLRAGSQLLSLDLRPAQQKGNHSWFCKSAPKTNG